MFSKDKIYMLDGERIMKQFNGGFSRSSWKLLHKLGSSNIALSQSDSSISPNAVATRLVNVSNSAKLERNAKQEMEQMIQKQRRTAIALEELSRCFNVLK